MARAKPSEKTAAVVVVLVRQVRGVVVAAPASSHLHSASTRMRSYLMAAAAVEDGLPMLLTYLSMITTVVAVVAVVAAVVAAVEAEAAEHQN